MKASDILDIARNQFLDDGLSDYLWQNTTLLANLNDAEIEASERGELIADKDTATDAEDRALCSISIQEGVSDYVISPKIIRVSRLKIAGWEYPLTHLTRYQLDVLWPGWESATGIPQYYILHKGLIAFVPTPSAADTASLEIKRLPLNSLVLSTIAVVGSSNISFDATTKTISMPTGNFISAGLRPGYRITVSGTVSNNGTFTVRVCNKTSLQVVQSLTTESNKSATISADSCPEIPESQHTQLIDWICVKAYSSRDLEQTSVQLRDAHEAAFERNFGRKPSATAMRLRLESPSNQRVLGRPFGS